MRFHLNDILKLYGFSLKDILSNEYLFFTYIRSTGKAYKLRNVVIIRI